MNDKIAGQKAIRFECNCFLRCIDDPDLNTISTDNDLSRNVFIFTLVKCDSPLLSIKCEIKIDCHIYSLGYVSQDHFSNYYEYQNQIVIGFPKSEIHFESCEILLEKTDYIRCKNIISFNSSENSALWKTAIPPSNFYSSKYSKKSDALATSLIISEDSNEIFRVFSIQKLAFQYYDELTTCTRNKKLHSNFKIYSFESLWNGQRKFLVSEHEAFLQKYTNTEMQSRHVYEIIRTDFPCRLYFDLEFSILYNNQLDGHLLVKKWLTIVSWKLYELYGVCIHGRNIIDLDSTTPEKFSRHIIIILYQSNFNTTASSLNLRKALESMQHNIDLLFNSESNNSNTIHSSSTNNSSGGSKKRSYSDRINSNSNSNRNNDHFQNIDEEVLFLNNQHVGKFVDYVLNSPSYYYSNSDTELAVETTSTSIKTMASEFMVSVARRDTNNGHDSKPTTCFIDRGVYSKNRAFRLFMSCKYSKQAVLKVTKAVTGKTIEGTNYILSAIQDKAQVSRRNRIKHILENSYIVPVTIVGPPPPSPLSSSSLFSSNETASNNYLRFPDVLEEYDSPILTANANGEWVNVRNHNNSISNRDAVVNYNHSNNISIVASSSSSSSSNSPFDYLPSTSLTTSNIYGSSSPFPLLDLWITQYACKGGIQGKIKSWLLTHILPPCTSVTTLTSLKISEVNDNSNTTSQRSNGDQIPPPLPLPLPPTLRITYQIVNNHWCDNIQRAHKSNHIMYEVDLNRGLLYQKCWDPDCRGYRSPSILLSLTILPTEIELLSFLPLSNNKF